MDDAPRSGRPVELESDQIKTLTENNEHYNTWEIADILKISNSMKLSVKWKTYLLFLWEKTQMDLLANPILGVLDMIVMEPIKSTAPFKRKCPTPLPHHMA